MDEYEDDGSELDQSIEQQEIQLQQAEAERQQQIEIRLLRNKLRKIKRDLGITRTKLKENEKKVIKQAKKIPALKKDIKMIDTMLVANKMKNTSKLMTSSPLLMYVFFGALIVLVVICAVAFVGSLFPWLFPGDESGGGNVANPVSGITGNDFYGIRMIYTDETKATGNMVENYVEFVENSIDDVTNISKATSGGETYTLTLNLNVTLPIEDYDYLAFNEDTFKSEYVEVYSIVYEMAKIVYFVDNGTAYAGPNLVDCLSGIKYFGFANIEEIAPMVADEIIKLVEITSVKNSAGVEITDNTILASVKTSFVETAKTQIVSKDYSRLKIRTEKLFIKDYIIENADEMVKDIKKENYVAMIFMAKKSVTFSQFSFSVGNADLSNFTISLSNNGEEITLSKDDSNFTTDDSEMDNYIFTTNDDLNVQTTAFDDIDTTNLRALENGLSLFDIVKDENIDYLKYLKSEKDVNLVDYLTAKQNGVVVKTFNTEAFNMAEMETMWKSAS